MPPLDLHPGAVKVFRATTHRVRSPEATLEWMRPWMALMGITRLANVTGLDRIGLPVVVACRPNSRSLSVSQGKGVDLAAARASALMESVESWHAERIELPLRLGSFEDLRYNLPLCDVGGLPRLADSVFHRDRQLLWIEGFDILTGCGRWVPFELVHTNYTLPSPTGSVCFAPSSNGLASGNHLLEAVEHALCEVVERDATALWNCDPSMKDSRVDLSTVDDEVCRSVLDRYFDSGVRVAVWDITSDIGVPVFACLVADEWDPLHPVHAALGYGCHPTRRIALVRALTEAAQSRLTLITGSREDVLRVNYARSLNPDVLSRARAAFDEASPSRRFDDGPEFDGYTLDDDVAWVVERLEGVGLEQVVVVDLTRPELGIPVARVIVPGLEGVTQLPGYLPGRRARKVMCV